MMNKRMVFPFTLILILGVAFAGYRGYLLQRKNDPNSFAACVAAGNPVMESYPRKCNANGMTFTEDLNPTDSGDGGTTNGLVVDTQLPVPAQKAKEEVSKKYSIPLDKIIVLEVLEKDWPDACLGIAEKGQMCAQVITPGFSITLQTDDMLFKYRTDREGSVIKQESSEKNESRVSL